MALRDAVPGLDDDLARGDTSKATGWLRENVQQYGGLRTPMETIAHATGAVLSEAPLLEYLEQKFKGIYGL